PPRPSTPPSTAAVLPGSASVSPAGDLPDRRCVRRALLDRSVHQAAGAASLANEQVAQGDQRQRSGVHQAAEDLGLRRRDAKRRELLGKQPVPFTLYPEDKEARLFFRTRKASFVVTGRRDECATALRVAKRMPVSGSCVGR